MFPDSEDALETLMYSVFEERPCQCSDGDVSVKEKPVTGIHIIKLLCPFTRISWL